MSQSNTVRTKINYFLPPKDGSRPYINISGPPAHIPGEVDPDLRYRNWVSVAREVDVEDLRGAESTVSLDSNGFQFVDHVSEEKEFNFGVDADERCQLYYRETEQLVKDATGANRVVIFDHTIRRRQPEATETGPENRQPVPLVHVDQTPAAAEARVKRHLPEPDVPELLSKRYQIINIWRPIHHPAEDHPLALCDFRSVDVQRDLVPMTLVFPERTGETYSVLYNSDHQWKYKKGMRTDEVVLIKCFDSRANDSVASFTPHTAFEDPSTAEGAPLRESIELRALAFYP